MDDRALEIQAARDDFILEMPDTGTVKRLTLAPVPGQPGRRQSTETIIAVLPCKVVAAPRRQIEAGAQVQEIADWAVRFPARADIQSNDRLDITLGEGGTKAGEVENVMSKSGELACLVMIRKAGR